MRKWLSLGIVGLISVALIMTACAPPEEKAPTVEEFYKGASIDLVVPYKPGGGFDAYARILAPFLAPELGAKEVLVENKAGGGGYTAANWLYLQAPRDGSTIAILNGTILVVNELFGKIEVAKFKSVKEFSIIAAWSGTPSIILATPKLAANSLQELKELKGLKCGTTDPFDVHAIGGAILAETLNLQDFRIIAGYEGSADIDAAVYRGELDLNFTSYESGKKIVDKGFAKALGILGDERVSMFPDTPTVLEVGVVPGTEKLVEIYNASIRGILRFFVAPPEVPADRVKFLSAAFAKVVQNPDFQQELETRQRLIYRPVIADEALARIDKVLAMSDKEKEEFRYLIEKKYLQ